VDQEFSWLNIGIDIIVDYVTLQSRWMLKQSDKTKKLLERKEKSLKPKESLKKSKLPIKPQLLKVKLLLKELKKERNDFHI
jgi:hypothetical protein